MAGYWDQLVDAVVRPPRDKYTEADLVGGTRARFSIGGSRYYREDLTLTNKWGQKLVASHYRPNLVVSADGRLPAVVYAHSNSGSRCDAEEVLRQLLPLHVTVLALDCAGSGLSDGEHVTLGAREQDDVAAAVEHLASSSTTLGIAVWGRSQGAASAALLAGRGAASGLSAVVLDSSFSRLRDLMMELADRTPFRAARPVARLALSLMRRSVQRRAGFDVASCAPLDAVGRATVPAMLGHAAADSFVGSHHSVLLREAWGAAGGRGEAELQLFEGDHNSMRPLWWYEAASDFLLDAFGWREMSRRTTPAVLDDDAVGGAAAALGPRASRKLAPPWSPSAILPADRGRVAEEAEASTVAARALSASRSASVREAAAAGLWQQGIPDSTLEELATRGSGFSRSAARPPAPFASPAAPARGAPGTPAGPPPPSVERRATTAPAAQTGSPLRDAARARAARSPSADPSAGPQRPSARAQAASEAASAPAGSAAGAWIRPGSWGAPPASAEQLREERTLRRPATVGASEPPPRARIVPVVERDAPSPRRPTSLGIREAAEEARRRTVEARAARLASPAPPSPDPGRVGPRPTLRPAPRAAPSEGFRIAAALAGVTVTEPDSP